MQLRDPVVSTIVILSLAAGIAANVAVFTVARGVLLRPLPFSGVDRIFDVRKAVAANADTMFLGPEFVGWRRGSKACSSLAAYQTTTVTVGGQPGAERVTAAEVSPGFFKLLGIVPVAGREFGSGEEQPGSRVAIVSEIFARSRWGRVSDAVGAVVRIDDAPYAVIGVVPSSLPFPSEDVELWLPYEITAMGLRVRRVPGVQSHSPGRVPVLCRLARSSTLEQARTEATTVLHTLMVPESRGARAHFIPLSQRVLGGVTPLLLLLQCAVGLLLLLIAANAANLLLARSLERERDLLVRCSLGATSRQLVPQAFVEALVPGLAGGAIGLVVTYWMVHILKGVAPPDVPRLAQVHGDLWLILVDVAVTLLAGGVAALPPAFHTWRTIRRFAGGPADERLRTSASARAPARQALIVMEMVLAVTLVSACVTVVSAYLRLARSSVGFDGRGVTTARLAFPDNRYAATGQRIEFLQQLVRSVGQNAAVRGVSVINDLPFVESPSTLDFTIPSLSTDAPMVARSRLIDSQYFHIMRVPVVGGRGFEQGADDYPASPAVVVNQSFARRYFPGKVVAGSIRSGDIEWRILGVVADTPDRALVADEPAVYRLFTQLDRYPRINPAFRWLSRVFLVATDEVSSAATIEALRGSLRALDPELTFDDFQPMDARVARSYARTTFAAALMLILAAVSTILAGVGVFGAFTHWVARRTREFGVRTALGATPAALLRLVLYQAALAAVVGLAAGCLVARQGQKLLTSAIPGVTPSEATTVIVTALVMFVVATVACLPPAIKASRIDPAEALRTD